MKKSLKRLAPFVNIVDLYLCKIVEIFKDIKEKKADFGEKIVDSMNIGVKPIHFKQWDEGKGILSIQRQTRFKKIVNRRKLCLWFVLVKKAEKELNWRPQASVSATKVYQRFAKKYQEVRFISRCKSFIY